MEQQIDKLDENSLKQLVQACALNTALYAKTFLADRFSLPWTELHKEIWKVIDAKVQLSNGELIPKYRKVCIIGPRSIGKTSIAKTCADKAIRYGTHPYIIYLGKNETFATLQTDNIKRTLLQNRLANSIFPNQDKPTTVEGNKIPADFSKKAWMINDTLIMPRGWGQPIRGLNIEFNLKTYRPSLIIIDDLEDPQEIKSPVTRASLRRWFFADVEKAIPPEKVSMDWQIIYIDTLKHQDALPVHLMNDPTWKVIVLPIAEDDGKFISKAEDFLSSKTLQAEYTKHKNLGLLNVFYQEWMCKHTATELLGFTKEQFKYYRETNLDFLEAIKNGHFINIVIGDPAKTAQMNAADSAIVIWGIDLLNRKIYLRDYARGKWTPSQFRSNCFYYARMYGAISLGIEVTGLNEYITEPFRTDAQRLGVNFPIEELSANTHQARDPEFGPMSGKVSRIAPLGQYYEKGMIYHNMDKCKDFEEQLLDFPSPKLWDLIDAGSYIQHYIKRYNLLFDKLEEQDYLAKQIEDYYSQEVKPLPDLAGVII